MHAIVNSENISQRNHSPLTSETDFIALVLSFAGDKF
ncbi:hypothetical protein T4B_6592 [Trichinella pseudospiralis]|uniref:Uncharacterized protein n=1 Tax=Trichinella pseudospiralis TaxID=6337 RepID=A0A0V1G978_TRIPS|nr:hypothetical protein T4B_6592 [Trichinella pseudospiralis]